jgi:hypothetical protein
VAAPPNGQLRGSAVSTEVYRDDVDQAPSERNGALTWPQLGAVGAAALAVLAALGVYVFGAILAYVAFTQPGPEIAFAVAYLALGLGIPILVVMRMSKSGRRARAVALASAISIAASVFFFAVAAVPLAV